MVLIIGWIALVLFGMAAFGLGSTVTAWLAKLPRRYPEKYFPLVFGLYLAASFGAGLAAATCMGLLRPLLG